MAEISELLSFYNPWWRGPYKTNLFRRPVLEKIARYASGRQVIVLNGLRRAGKTSIMKMLIEGLLSKNEPKDIMYFSFDGSVKDPDYIVAVVKEYRRLMDPGKPCHLFLDEVQFIEGWEWAVKRLYDSGEYRMVLSGSSSFSIRRGSGKALVGRTFDFVVSPFSPRELLAIGGCDAPKLTFGELMASDIPVLEKKFFINKEEFEAASRRYLERGGLPETIGMDDEKTRDYLKDSVVDKVIFRDIGETLGVREPAKIQELFVALCETPGFLLDINSIAGKLGISRKTASDYLEYLKNAFLIRELYNYTGRRSKSLRKGKRYYPFDNSLAAYSPPIRDNAGYLAENAAVACSRAEYFWRERDKEVDIVLEHGRNPLPIEVKYRADVGTRDLEGLFSFGSQFGAKEAMVLTRDELSQKTLTSYGREMKIRFIPLWLFMLQDQR